MIDTQVERFVTARRNLDAAVRVLADAQADADAARRELVTAAQALATRVELAPAAAGDAQLALRIEDERRRPGQR